MQARRIARCGCRHANINAHRTASPWVSENRGEYPGGNHPLKCNIVLQIQGTQYVRVAPTEPGTFECNDDWVVSVADTPGNQAAKLDANRISQQFATS